MLNAVFNLFFPEVCLACKQILLDNEKLICTNCRHSLPVTNFHFTNDNTTKNVLFGRAHITDATSLLRFEKKGITQQLIHQLKYKNRPELSDFFGKWLGEELLESNQFKNIDVVIPVPLHPKKLKKRGYNQVEGFAKALANKLKAKYIDNVLIKKTDTSSQVKKKRLERWLVQPEIFSIQNISEIENKHILLVDDIITTGATLETCINQLKTAKDINISIATIAIA